MMTRGERVPQVGTVENSAYISSKYTVDTKMIPLLARDRCTCESQKNRQICVLGKGARTDEPPLRNQRRKNLDMTYTTGSSWDKRRVYISPSCCKNRATYPPSKLTTDTYSLLLEHPPLAPPTLPPHHQFNHITLPAHSFCLPRSQMDRPPYLSSPQQNNILMKQNGGLKVLTLQSLSCNRSC